MKFKNYTIKANGYNRYDLSKEVEKERKETKEKHTVKVEIAYALPFERCLFYIISELTDAAECETIQSHIDTFESLLNEVKTLTK